MAKKQTPIALRCSEHAYRLLLLLYPRLFRQAFGQAMRLDFRAYCRDAWRAGGLPALARAWLLVLIDVLKSVPAEHLAGLERLRVFFAQPQPQLQPALQTGDGAPPTSTTPSGSRRATPRETIIAALPLLLLLIMVAVPRLPQMVKLSSQAQMTISTVMQIASFAMLGVAFILAWRARFPAWSATWMPFWMLIGYYLPVNLLQSLVRNVEWPGWNLIWNAATIVLLVLLAYLLYRLARRDRRLSILASLPLVVIASMFWSEFVQPGIAGLVDNSALLLALILTVIGSRSPGWKSLLALAGVFALALGMAEAAAQVYALNVPTGERPAPQLADLAWRAAGLVIPRLMFLFGPLLAAHIRALGLAAGPRGRRAYRLALGGVLAMLLTMLLESMLTSGPNWQSMLRWRPVGYALLLAGAGLYLIGWGLMLREAWHNGQRFPALPLALLALSGLLLPVMLATYSGSVGFSLSLGSLFDNRYPLEFAAGGILLALLMYTGALAFQDPPSQPVGFA